MTTTRRLGRESLKLPVFFSELSALLLSLVFAYTAVSKLYDWRGTRSALYNQVFPGWMAEMLLYGLPVVELVAVVLLLVPAWRRVGFWLSLVLMAAFTAYVGLVLTEVFGRVPCSCGGVISSLGWGEHFVLNGVLTALAAMGMRGEGSISRK